MSPADDDGTARWVVLGGSGFVGRAVVAELEHAGRDVVVVPAPRLLLPLDEDSPAQVLDAAAGPADALRGVLAGATHVVVCAGLATPTARRSEALLGANALLPVVVACAAPARARVVHVSSAAVQGRGRLDDSGRLEPLTPYARSKALGEQALGLLARPGTVVLRATSVQGTGRAVSGALAAVARSPLSSVAGAGDAPTPVTSVTALARLVRLVGEHPGPVPPVVLQPWEGWTTASLLREVGGREPRRLPAGPSRAVLAAALAALRLLGPRGVAVGRRAELMWLGQEQAETWLPDGWTT